MINWVEKGYGLIEEIKVQGHWIKQVDNLFVSSDDVAVQAIIDSYDPLPKAKAEAIERINEQAQGLVSSVVNAYPEFERLTFIDQEAEAKAYIADSNAITPILSTIATKRGLTVLELSNRVITKADAYRSLCANIMAERQRVEDLIDTSTDFQEIQNMNLE